MDMSSQVQIKICGITHLDDAKFALDAGCDRLGINLIPSSKRYMPALEAAAMIQELEKWRAGSRERLVAVVADQSTEELNSLQRITEIPYFQLHGSESPSALSALAFRTLKAIRVDSAEDIDLARLYPGEDILLDAKVEGILGGSGHHFDWELARQFARERRVWLAGGLRPDNVSLAIRTVSPFLVDVASGVEGSNPRRKDPELVLAFLREVRSCS